uniref:Uncharacterized protein n=1 Tax=Arundo donax TaxID=35708 RepID=A0A0A9C919_ARUDO
MFRYIQFTPCKYFQFDICANCIVYVVHISSTHRTVSVIWILFATPDTRCQEPR